MTSELNSITINSPSSSLYIGSVDFVLTLLSTNGGVFPVNTETVGIQKNSGPGTVTASSS